MKKHFITGVVVGGLIFGTVGAFAGQYVATENPFPVQLNGQGVSIEGYNIEGSTYFKLRDIADTIGGFDVGFDNDTIQLSKDGYSYSNTVSQTNNDIKYYSRPNWCPDFGAYTGAELCKTVTNGYMYFTDQTQVDQYSELLISMGFVKGKMEGTTTFVKDNYYFVSYAQDTPQGGIWGFIAGAGDWVPEHFVAE